MHHQCMASLSRDESVGRNCRVVGLLLKYGKIKTPGDCWLRTSFRYLIRIPTFVSFVWRFEAIWTSNGCFDQQRDLVAGFLWALGIRRHVREYFFNATVITRSQAEQISSLCFRNRTNISVVPAECYCLPYLSLYSFYAPYRFCGWPIKIAVVRPSAHLYAICNSRTAGLIFKKSVTQGVLRVALPRYADVTLCTANHRLKVSLSGYRNCSDRFPPLNSARLAFLSTESQTAAQSFYLYWTSVKSL